MSRRLIALVFYFLPELILLIAFSFLGGDVNVYLSPLFIIENPAFLLLVILFLILKLIRMNFISSGENEIYWHQKPVNITTLFFVLIISIGLINEVSSVHKIDGPLFFGLDISLLFKGIAGLGASWLIADLLFFLKKKISG